MPETRRLIARAASVCLCITDGGTTSSAIAASDSPRGTPVRSKGATHVPYLYRRLMHEKLVRVRQGAGADMRHMCCTHMQRPPTSDKRLDRCIRSLEEVTL
jgi:hypothetical protein